MITQRPGRMAETPDDLITAAVTAASPLLTAAELCWLATTAGHGPLGGRGGHLRLSPGQGQRRANQLDHAGGGDRR
jgi:hypothetical protein